MEELRKKLEELIQIKGTTDAEVLKLSQLLDNYIVNYFLKNPYSNHGQASLLFCLNLKQNNKEA